jgi:hypothetical protein
MGRNKVKDKKVGFTIPVRKSKIIRLVAKYGRKKITLELNKTIDKLDKKIV